MKYGAYASHDGPVRQSRSATYPPRMRFGSPRVSSPPQGGRRMAVAPGPSLAEVLRPEALLPVLREPGVLQVLAPHLPEEHRCVCVSEGVLLCISGVRGRSSAVCCGTGGAAAAPARYICMC